jgi:hypothetical protein
MNYVHAKFQIQQKIVHGETKNTNPYMNRCRFVDPDEYCIQPDNMLNLSFLFLFTQIFGQLETLHEQEPMYPWSTHIFHCIFHDPFCELWIVGVREYVRGWEH